VGGVVRRGCRWGKERGAGVLGVRGCRREERGGGGGVEGGAGVLGMRGGRRGRGDERELGRVVPQSLTGGAVLSMLLNVSTGSQCCICATYPIIGW
jgi:hypothetical protein